MRPIAAATRHTGRRVSRLAEAPRHTPQQPGCPRRGAARHPSHRATRHTAAAGARRIAWSRRCGRQPHRRAPVATRPSLIRAAPPSAPLRVATCAPLRGGSAGQGPGGDKRRVSVTRRPASGQRLGVRLPCRYRRSYQHRLGFGPAGTIVSRVGRVAPSRGAATRSATRII